jgi:hypothetical protein
MSYFVTLTYNTDHVPISNNGFKTLRKSDLQSFIKRLRKAHQGSEKISYYACGEYGTLNKRPHYHLILFGASDQQITQAWKTDRRENKPVVAIGDIYFGTVEPASCSYVLKYMSKPKVIGKFARDDRQPEFSCMSKGIGKTYLTSNMIRYHVNDLENRMVCTTLDQHKITMPRYYKERIYNSEQKGHLKGYFEWLSEIDSRIEREKYPTMSDFNYEKMKAEQWLRAEQNFRNKSTKNRS